MAIYIERRNEAGEDVREESYVGCVLATRERNGYDDSDFYAVVWDEEKQCCRDITYATTRAWTYNNGAVVDATEEVKRKARRWQRKLIARAYLNRETFRASEPGVGKVVRIKRTVGKGSIPAGSVGEVLKQRANPFRTYYRNGYNRPGNRENQQFLVEFDLGPNPGDRRRWWCSLKSCEVVDPPKVSWCDVRRHARAEESSYDRAFVLAGYFAM